MLGYDEGDFEGYFYGAHIMWQGRPLLLMLEADGCVHAKDAWGRGASVRIPSESVTWAHIQLPELGWRSAKDSEYLFHVSGLSARTRNKGLRPETLSFWLPPEIEPSSVANGHEYNELVRALRKPLEKGVVNSIYNPTFQPSLDSAIALLRDDTAKAVGAALSPEFAMTYSVTDGEIFSLYFHRRKVAHSLDEEGSKWSVYAGMSKDALDILHGKTIIREEKET